MTQNGYSWLDLSISLPSGLLALIIPQQVRFWLTSFSWGQSFRTECSCLFQNDSFCPLSYGKYEEIFLWHLLWESDWASRGKSYNIVGVFLCLGPSGIFNSELPAMSLLIFVNYRSGFLTTVLVPPVVSTGDFLIFSYLSVQSWKQWFSLCTYLS